MPETIAMTPPDHDGRSTRWFLTEDRRSGTLLLPKKEVPEDLKGIISGEIDVEKLPILGVGDYRKDHPATTYGNGSNAIRVISTGVDYSNYQNGLGWLCANVALKEAFKQYGENKIEDISTLEGLSYRIRTPEYLGMLIRGSLTYYLMSNEMLNRTIVDRETLGLTIGGIFRMALDALKSTYGSTDGVPVVDTKPNNFLFGEDDLVVLDASPAIPHPYDLTYL